MLWHLGWIQGIKRPKKSERKRIRKGTDVDRDDAEAGAGGRTAAEQIQEQLGFRNDGEGELIVLASRQSTLESLGHFNTHLPNACSLPTCNMVPVDKL